MNAPASLKVPIVAEIIEIDGRPVLVVPPEVLDKLGVGAGDTIGLLAEGDNVLIPRHGSARDRQMAVARDVMTRREAALRELAK